MRGAFIYPAFMGSCLAISHTWLPVYLVAKLVPAAIEGCEGAAWMYGDTILNMNNNSVFLLPKSIERGKLLISSAPRESE